MQPLYDPWLKLQTKVNHRENIVAIVALKEAKPERKARQGGVPIELRSNGLPRQNHSWFTTLVAIATEEALAMGLL